MSIKFDFNSSFQPTLCEINWDSKSNNCFCSCRYKDAVFLSPHKFVGGPGTPGKTIPCNNSILRSLLKGLLGKKINQLHCGKLNELNHALRKKKIGQNLVLVAPDQVGHFCIRNSPNSDRKMSVTGQYKTTLAEKNISTTMLKSISWTTMQRIVTVFNCGIFPCVTVKKFLATF